MITLYDASNLRTGTNLYYYNPDSNKIHRVRVSGMCKTWKTRPEQFRLPVKYGLYESFAVEYTLSHTVTDSLTQQEYPYFRDNRHNFYLSLLDAIVEHEDASVQEGLVDKWTLAYYQNRYAFENPPVATVGWRDSDWISYIHYNGYWLSPDRSERWYTDAEPSVSGVKIKKVRR